MKKLFLLFVLCVGVNTIFAQENEGGSAFPYGKMLKMSHRELLDAKFKYDSYRNQYVLTKLNGLNQTVSILGALAGTPQNYIPHVDDYRVVIQGGAIDYASIEVTFYDNNVYDMIFEFATTNGQDLIETGTGNLRFAYDNYAFVLTRRLVGQSMSYANRGMAASHDQSYTFYTFAVFTDVEPSSAWHSKQAFKEKKRESRGAKKQSAADLM